MSGADWITKPNTGGGTQQAALVPTRAPSGAPPPAPRAGGASWITGSAPAPSSIPSTKASGGASWITGATKAAPQQSAAAAAAAPKSGGGGGGLGGFLHRAVADVKQGVAGVAHLPGSLLTDRETFGEAAFGPKVMHVLNNLPFTGVPAPPGTNLGNKLLAQKTNVAAKQQPGESFSAATARKYPLLGGALVQGPVNLFEHAAHPTQALKDYSAHPVLGPLSDLATAAMVTGPAAGAFKAAAEGAATGAEAAGAAGDAAQAASMGSRAATLGRVADVAQGVHGAVEAGASGGLRPLLNGATIPFSDTRLPGLRAIPERAFTAVQEGSTDPVTKLAARLSPQSHTLSATILGGNAAEKVGESGQQRLGIKLAKIVSPDEFAAGLTASEHTAPALAALRQHLTPEEFAAHVADRYKGTLSPAAANLAADLTEGKAPPEVAARIDKAMQTYRDAAGGQAQRTEAFLNDENGKPIEGRKYQAGYEPNPAAVTQATDEAKAGLPKFTKLAGQARARADVAQSAADRAAAAEVPAGVTDVRAGRLVGALRAVQDAHLRSSVKGAAVGSAEDALVSKAERSVPTLEQANKNLENEVASERSALRQQYVHTSAAASGAARTDMAPFFTEGPLQHFAPNAQPDWYRNLPDRVRNALHSGVGLTGDPADMGMVGKRITGQGLGGDEFIQAVRQQLPHMEGLTENQIADHFTQLYDRYAQMRKAPFHAFSELTPNHLRNVGINDPYSEALLGDAPARVVAQHLADTYGGPAPQTAATLDAARSAAVGDAGTKLVAATDWARQAFDRVGKPVGAGAADVGLPRLGGAPTNAELGAFWKAAPPGEFSPARLSTMTKSLSPELHFGVKDGAGNFVKDATGVTQADAFRIAAEKNAAAAAKVTAPTPGPLGLSEARRNLIADVTAEHGPDAAKVAARHFDALSAEAKAIATETKVPGARARLTAPLAAAGEKAGATAMRAKVLDNLADSAEARVGKLVTAGERAKANAEYSIENAPARLKPVLGENRAAASKLVGVINDLQRRGLPDAAKAVEDTLAKLPTDLKGLEAAGVDAPHFFHTQELRAPKGGGAKGTSLPKLFTAGSEKLRTGSPVFDRTVAGQVNGGVEALRAEVRRATVDKINTLPGITTRLGEGPLAEVHNATEAAGKGFVPWNPKMLFDTQGRVRPVSDLELRLGITGQTRFMPTPLFEQFRNYFEPRRGQLLGAAMDPLNRVSVLSKLALSPAFIVGRIFGHGMLALAGTSDPAGLARNLFDVVRQYHESGGWGERSFDEISPPRLLKSSATTAEYARLVGDTAKGEGTGLAGRMSGAVAGSPVGRASGKLTELGNRLIAKPFKLASFMDDAQRTAFYLTEKSKVGDEAALESTLRMTGEYDRATPFERDYVRRFIPFWTWHRELTRIAFHLAEDHPLRVAWTLHLANLANQPDTTLTDQFAQGAKVGGRVVDTGYLNPFNEVGDATGGGLLGFGKILGPGAKLVASNLTGENPSTGRPYTRPPGTGKDNGNVPTAPSVARQLLQPLPQKRLFDTLTGADRIKRYDTGQPNLDTKGVPKPAVPSSPLRGLAAFAGFPMAKAADLTKAKQIADAAKLKAANTAAKQRKNYTGKLARLGGG